MRFKNLNKGKPIGPENFPGNAKKRFGPDILHLGLLVMIIGGSTIYELLLPQIDRMYLTYVDAELEGDAWFPDYDVSQWAETDSVTHQADEKNRFACRFVTLEKN